MKKYHHLPHKIAIGTLLMAFSSLAPVRAQHVLNVDSKLGAPIQSTMYGLFLEDINYAADGGLYGELVKNRSFEFPEHFTGWQAFGKVTIKNDGPFERAPFYVLLSDPGHDQRRTGLTNEGYFGIGVTKNESYRFSVWAKPTDEVSRIRVQLVDESSNDESQVLATAAIEVDSPAWSKYETTLTAPKTVERAKLRIFLDSPKAVALEHISLFPVDTYKGRANGLRRDIAQALEDAHPGILRFPGGCIVEGTDLATRYEWKKTVGPVENRPLNQNRWQHTFEHRFFPDYFQSGGLGFFEYFQLAEDIGAEPLPVLSVGMACQFQSQHDAHPNAVGDELQEYIQDYLDLIEFANGDEHTTWGKVRAEMGHPAPFNLKYVGVGNEQWGEEYFIRFPEFVKAIRAKYPDIKIIGSSGPDSEGEMFTKGWEAMRTAKADLVDEHFYRNEEWFLGQGLRYDNYDRKGPKVFAGEYACHGTGKKWNHYGASILEAGFMTALERNADLVLMATYAPTLAHKDGWQWRPDMIWYDNLRTVRTTSWHVQQLYATHKGTNTLKLTMDGKPVAGLDGQGGLFASAVYDAPTQNVIVKVINTATTAQIITLNIKGVANNSQAETITLSHMGSYDDENTLDAPTKIAPAKGSIVCQSNGKNVTIDDELQPMSFKIYKLKR